MKKNLIITIICLFLIIGLLLVFNKKKVNDTIVINKTFEYAEKVNLSDIIENYKGNTYFDTSTLGNKHININFNNDSYKINYNIVDTTKPIMMGVSNITITKGDKVKFNNIGLCGDNYDRNIKCIVNGYYDVNTIGNYKLKYIATDSSGNTAESNFYLFVKDKIKDSNTSKKSNFDFNDLIKNYKTDNTLVGIDVSAWQDNIDFKKVKDAGCDFVMIRIGYGFVDNEIKLDNYFTRNFKNAKSNNLKVGLYFYSYAKTTNEAKNQAKWIVNNLNGETLDLPIAFDFENWKKFNSYHINFNDINEIANEFINEVQKYGYKGMLYGSANYLNKVWNTKNKDIWLAHYTKKTDYNGDYSMWQIANNGKINGINGNVDLDILYY